MENISTSYKYNENVLPAIYKITVADDHEIVIDGIMAMLDTSTDLRVTGKAANGQQLLDILKHKPVDMVIMDIDMPQMDGVEATLKLKQAYPHIKVLVLTMYSTPEFISQLVRHGADGYLLKNTPKRIFLEAIREIKAGKRYFPSDIKDLLIDGIQQHPALAGSPPELTDREKQIVHLVARQFTSKEIGEKLFLSYHTVERHRKNIFAKLGIKNMAGLALYAKEHGLMDV